MSATARLIPFCLLLLAAAGGPRQGHAQAPGAGNWENVEMLAGTGPAEMDLFMRAMSVSLGVGCEYCHDGDAWHLDNRPEKETARSMMRAIGGLSRSGFEALELPTCWTCHRGSALPALRVGEAAVQAVEYPESAFSRSGESAGSVYENLQVLGSLPAGDLAGAMAGFSASLGVQCAYCHVAGDWSSDRKLEKLLARRMYEIQTELNEAGPGGSPGFGEEVSCWTCHRGEPVPVLAVPGLGGEP